MSYHVVIPTYLWEDDKIPWKIKKLYGRIYSLCSKEGYCWASNNYLANEIKTSPRTIQRYLKTLEKIGEINCEINQKDGNERKIWIRNRSLAKAKREGGHDSAVVRGHDTLKVNAVTRSRQVVGESVTQVRERKNNITQSDDCEIHPPFSGKKESREKEEREESGFGKESGLEGKDSSDSTLSDDSPNPEIKQLIDYFFNKCVESWHFKPEISGAIAGAKIKAKLKTYSKQELEKEFRWYLVNFLRREGMEKFGFGIQTALSDYVFNLWLKEKNQWD